MRTVQERFPLRGRTAIVTGGSRGPGLQMAEAPGEQGARVLLAARKRGELEGAVALCASDAGKDITGQVLAVGGGVSAV